MQPKSLILNITWLISVLLFVIDSGNAWPHCDGMDGPVVKAAQHALESENISPVLIWVQEKDENEIRKAFRKTLAVRQLSAEAKELADRYFFETLVRIHRAGEGAPYTGLKPAGRDLGPAIPAGDKAIESGRVEPLLKLLQDTVQNGLQSRFHPVLRKKNFEVSDVENGRRYVDSYVRFIHYIEHVYESAAMSAEGHYPKSKEAGSHN